MDGLSPVIIDTSTLINFLAVDRLDLLTENPRFRFIVTEHARAEVTDHYPDQLIRLQTALDAGTIQECPVVAIDELRLFSQLAATRQLGPGECATIAAAGRPDHALAIDDKLAQKKARNHFPDLVILTTSQIMVELIRDKRITVADADAIKESWAAHCRFVLKIGSFQELL
jgi:predicted nucleic acid-binding protein